jgi:peroxiredoxin
LSGTNTLARGDQVPHFEVKTLEGGTFSYATVWQRKNLVLVIIPRDGDAGLASELAALRQDFADRESVCVVTRDRVAGVPTPGALVADRWGEIVHVAAPSHVDGLPAAAELLQWLDHVQQRCPECEGEAK